MAEKTFSIDPSSLGAPEPPKPHVQQHVQQTNTMPVAPQMHNPINHPQIGAPNHQFAPQPPPQAQPNTRSGPPIGYANAQTMYNSNPYGNNAPTSNFAPTRERKHTDT